MALPNIFGIECSFNLALLHVSEVLRAEIIFRNRLVVHLVSAEVIVWLSLLLHSLFLGLAAVA